MLSAGWLVYALVTGTLVAAACWAADGLARTRRLPTRWIWAAGLGATLVLSARALVTTLAERGVTVVPFKMPVTTAATTAAQRAPGLMLGLLDASAEMLRTMLIVATHAMPRWIALGAALVWLAASVLLVVMIGLVHWRIGRQRSAWPAAALHGHDVRIAPGVGPAVLGVLRAVIVVPRWLLARSEAEQRLVLAHESEHVRARDHLLLSAAWIVAALVPWHPGAWWMLARLRLAIELDCDARVLRRGVGPRVYGSLLIDLAGQCSGFTAGATALADEGSHLERRLLAMKPARTPQTPLRAGLLLGASLLAVLAACEAKVPTSADVQNMDVTSAERSASSINLVDRFGSANTSYFIDGVKSDAATARALPKNRIASIEVKKLDGSSEIRINTAPDGSTLAGGVHVMVTEQSTGTGTMSIEQHGDIKADHAEHMRTFTGVVYIDGVKSDNARLQSLDPRTIVSMEVIKGPKAAQESSDPAAANGIIRVTTKAGGTK